MKALNIFAITDDGCRFALECKDDGDSVRYELPAECFAGKAKMEIHADEFAARSGDPGYYLIPGEEKMAGTALIRFKPLSDDESICSDNPTINFFAVNDGNATHVVIVEYNYLYSLYASVSSGRYDAYLYVSVRSQPVRDPFVLHVITLGSDADYNAVAKAVRDYRLSHGEIRPLAEKCREREMLEYARKYPLVRIRMGWKPVPAEVLHQTPENEPPMHVACTFAEVRELADRLKARGVEGVELSLVGWNQKGHDGRWPQIFPVEEALGGEDELIRTVKHVQELGYVITCHTNTSDHYEIADCFSEDDLVIDYHGKHRTHGNWASGESLASCPTAQLRYAKQDLPKVAALGFSGLHYIDCLSICRPEVCFHPNHPVTLRESTELLLEIMRESKRLFGGFSSEGIRDFALGELDFSLYNQFRSYLLSYAQKPYAMVDEVIPLIELTYHGVTLYNPSSATVNAAVKGDAAVSQLALFGARPAMYVYSKFVTPKDKPFTSIGDNWMGEEDLRINNASEMERTVDAIARIAEEYKLLADRQTVYIESFKHLDNGLFVTRYEDGVEIAASLSDVSAEYRGRVIASGKYEVFA